MPSCWKRVSESAKILINCWSYETKNHKMRWMINKYHLNNNQFNHRRNLKVQWLSFRSQFLAPSSTLFQNVQTISSNSTFNSKSTIEIVRKMGQASSTKVTRKRALGRNYLASFRAMIQIEVTKIQMLTRNQKMISMIQTYTVQLLVISIGAKLKFFSGQLWDRRI